GGVRPGVPRVQRRAEGGRGRPPEAVLQRAPVRRGAASDPGRAPAGRPAEEPRRAPDVRGADLRGAPGVRRGVEVDVVVSPSEADAPGPARADEAGTGECLHDQGPGGSPEAPPGQPIELPRRRGRPVRGPLDATPELNRPITRFS